MIAGDEAVVKIYPSVAHAFVLFPSNNNKETAMAYENAKTFIGDCLARSKMS